MRLTHVRLLVDDYGESFRFWRDVAGLGPTFGNESSGYSDFAAGGVDVAIFDRNEQAEVVGAARESATLLVFRVADVDAAVAELRARGAAVLGEPLDRPDWGIRVADLRDPAGNLLEVNHEIPASG